MSDFSFHKNERLCSKKTIGELFSSGESFLVYPIKVVWKEVEHTEMHYPSQVGFSVPKRLFKKAPHRNLLKRRLRESFRQSKNKLYTHLTEQNKKVVFMVVYIAKEQCTYEKINQSVNKSLDLIIEKTSHE